MSDFPTKVIMSREFLEGVENMVVEMLADLEDDMVAAMLDNQQAAYGDVVLTDPVDRVMKFLDDDETGKLDALQEVDEETAARRTRQFRRDAERLELT